ncbi:hypothetical protein AB4Z01_01390 [Inquilinus sp. YAF38]|uniref:hypothetical protein n=1 Tax=Inquilinus sp. YAF38 TaxID=3233084 RepID=UPI003F925C44
MIPPRAQANDNYNPADAFELQMDEVKRRFVAKLACAARGGHPSGSPLAAMPHRSAPEPSKNP